MKKSVLLKLLLGLTLLYGVFVYHSASHTDLSLENKITQKLEDQKNKLEMEAKESEISSDWVDAAKDLAQKAGESVARFLFSLIYK